MKQKSILLRLKVIVFVLFGILFLGGYQTMAKEKVNILVLGQYESRFETIMINTYNPNNHETQIISIPPGAIFLDGENLLREESLHFVMEEKGIKSVLSPLGDYLGVELPYYLIIDYAGAQDVVDAMGGVVFELPYMIELPPSGQEPALHLPTGVQTFDGNTARRFLRYRTEDLNGPGELQVIQLQQLFLDAMIRQLAQQKWKVIPIAFKLPKMIKTNIGLFKILDLAYGAIDIQLETLDVEFGIIPGEFVQTDGIYYYQIQGLHGYINKKNG